MDTRPPSLSLARITRLGVFVLVVSAGLLTQACARSKWSSQPFPLGVPLEVTVVSAPTPFHATDGRNHVAYELRLANLYKDDVILDQVDVLDAANGSVLARYAGPELKRRLGPRGIPPGLRMPRKTFVVVFVWLDLGSVAAPRELSHRIHAHEPGRTAAQGRTVDGARFALRPDTLVLGPPLRGGPWWAANGPSNDSKHRRALLPIDGRVALSQRFATDWVRGDEAGKLLHSGDPRRNSSWFSYGQEVLAVADGIVSSIRDGIPENVPQSSSYAVPIDIGTAAGNHIMLDLGGGRFALYAHLQPGSLRVKPGDRVTRGQVLARLGNSGNSTGPHLHLHVSDGATPLAGQGLPFAFDRFEYLGRVENSKLVPLARPRTCRDELPLENDAVRFP
jgi:hypothetical protein